MADRVSVFTDSRVIEAAERFTCAADEVWRLQRGADHDCIFFQKAVNRGERIRDGGSRQGTYVFSPSGKLLARCNTRNIPRVLEVLSAGWEAFQALPAEERRLAQDAELDPEHRWENSEPEDGLILDRVARDLLPPLIEGERGRRWNRDWAWFARHELDGCIDGSAAIGQRFELDGIARRLARFHLVDNVRGQTLPFAPEEVLEARLTARVVGRDGEHVELELEGTTHARADGPWLLGFNLWKPNHERPHGMETVVTGTALWNTRGHFEAFELIAVGRRQGRTSVNGRGRDTEDESLVGFHFTQSDPGRGVAPTFVAVYDADWIEPPAVPTWLRSPAECAMEEEGLGLSEAGREAYLRLLTAERFTSHAVGDGGETPDEVLALRLLAREEHATRALLELEEHGTVAGRLFALCGLWKCDPQTFAERVSAWQPAEERTVAFQDGCILITDQAVGALLRAENPVRLEAGESVRGWLERRRDAGGPYAYDIAGGAWPNVLMDGGGWR